jgi:hypothetical protein
VYAELLLVQLELRLAARSWDDRASSITAMCIDLEEVGALAVNTNEEGGGLQPLTERWAAVKHTVQVRLSAALDFDRPRGAAHSAAASETGTSILSDLTAQADSFGT